MNTLFYLSLWELLLDFASAAIMCLWVCGVLHKTISQFLELQVLDDDDDDDDGDDDDDDDDDELFLWYGWPTKGV